MKVKALKRVLEGVSDEAEVVFQGNIRGEEDEEDEDSDDPTYTTCLGPVFSAWVRRETNELVLDCAITEQE